ncbi:MAG: hypothetical protein ABR866_10035 [Candidatus Korobacteraceae bacterium]|jgi:hypothetical protein
MQAYSELKKQWSSPTSDRDWVMEERTVIRMGRISFVALVAVLLVTGSVVASEIAFPAAESTIPPNKAWDTQFILNYSAIITVEYRIEGGKSIDFYFMTREQDDRAHAGSEPTRPGIDYIHHASGVVGSGSFAENLSPGNYNVIFRNSSDQPVRVWRRALGDRR